MISLEYDKNNEQLITPQNALKFIIQYKTRKENNIAARKHFKSE